MQTTSKPRDFPEESELLMPLLVLATTNPGKVKEFRALLARSGAFAAWTLVTPADLGFSLPPIEETGATFAENARLKAVETAQLTGQVALADDSGLCVNALGGAPGLHSARWAGPDATDGERTARLLAELEYVPASQRTARFVCAAALAYPDGSVQVAEGACEGVITDAPRGTNGFGYDPVFLIPTQNRTLAELANDEKNAFSHRAQALARLGALLAEFTPTHS